MAIKAGREMPIEKGACTVRIKTVVGSMAAVMMVGFSANQANAQFLRHGISVQKGCDGPFCVGDTTSCTFLVSYNDDYGDTTMIMEAYDQLDTDGDGTFETRIPAAGNLPIIEAGGNTTCTVGGSLPCNLGPADPGAGLEAGFVIFQQNEYVIGPNDVSPLEDQGHVIWQDQCDAPGTSNCSTAVNDAAAPAATMFPTCNDDDACTNDSCDGGVCSFESVCLDPNYDCDDSNVCTEDVCDDTLDGCCAHNPIPCEERACYTNTGCDPASGCQYEPVTCDDGDPCTEDSCNPDTGACDFVVIDPPPIGCGLACRVTGGGVDTFDRLSYGQSKKGDASLAEGVSDDGGNANRYTMGGQAGAPTAEQPQPYGEWTHHNQRGHNGRFVFHAGTASAPPMTEIDLIECSDAGWCVQARPAPAKQIDFQGIGTFKNLDNKAEMSFQDIAPDASFVADETLHWFSVHIEDLGEPGHGGAVEPPAAFCPLEGSAGALADCGCPDFYEIRIHATADPSSPMVYHVYGYITGGNLQIHPPILRSTR